MNATYTLRVNVTIDKSIYFFITKKEKKKKKKKEEDAFRANSKHFVLAALNSWFDNYHFSREHFRSNPFYSVLFQGMDRSLRRGEGMFDKTRRQTFRRIFTARIFIHLLVLGSPSSLTNGKSNFRIFFNGTRTTSICRKQVAPIFLSASNWSILFLPSYCLFFSFYFYFLYIFSLSLSLSLSLSRLVRLVK